MFSDANKKIEGQYVYDVCMYLFSGDQLCKYIMVTPVMEFQDQGCKIKKIFA